MLKINYNRCDECGTCVGICPDLALILTNQKLDVDNNLCTDCKKCVAICPVAALKVVL